MNNRRHSRIWIYALQTMRQVVDGRLGRFRVYSILYVTFGTSALLLAVLGIYGVVSHLVSRRTVEIGIRMALGATPGRVSRTVVAGGLTQVVLGLLLGLAGAAWVAGGMARVLFDLNPFAPAMYVLAALVAFVAGLAACLIPARRAARVAPIVALRAD